METQFFHIITLSVTMKTYGWIRRNFKLIKLSCMLSLPASIKRIRSRTAEKNWRHRFSLHKPMAIFSDVQGQQTPQSVVQPGRISNSFEDSCKTSLPAIMKRIGWKTAEKMFRHRFLHYHPVRAFCCHGNKSFDQICPNVITCKYEKDLIKNSPEKVETFFPLKNLWVYFSDVQGHLTPQSVVQSGRNSNLDWALTHAIVTCKYKKERMKKQPKKSGNTAFFHHYPICYQWNQWLDLAEFQTHPSSHVCYHYLQVWKGSNQEKPRKGGDIVFPVKSLLGIFQTIKGSKLRSPWFNQADIHTRSSSHACHHCLQVWKGSDEKQPRKRGNTVFSIVTLCELFVARETRVLIRSCQNPMQLFPPPNDASDKIWLWSVHWLKRYACLKLLRRRTTDDGRRTMGMLKVTYEPSAQVI